MNDWVVDKLNKAERTKSSGPLQPLVDVVPTNIFQIVGRHVHAANHLLCGLLWGRFGGHAQRPSRTA